MGDATSQIQEIVDRETRGWDTQDVALLLSVFHPDMVWPWPETPTSHDPVGWRLDFGRYDAERWGGRWQELFDTHELVHNRRETRKIEVSEQQDGALAVVDIDTLWRSEDGTESHWRGRVCKVYSKVDRGWKMTMHTGVLEYPEKNPIYRRS